MTSANLNREEVLAQYGHFLGKEKRASPPILDSIQVGNGWRLTRHENGEFTIELWLENGCGGEPERMIFGEVVKNYGVVHRLSEQEK